MILGTGRLYEIKVDVRLSFLYEVISCKMEISWLPEIGEKLCHRMSR